MDPVDPAAILPDESEGGGKPDSVAPLVVRSNAIDRGRFPDLDVVQSVVLKDGDRVRKEAKYTVIVNRNTGELHHNQLALKTVKKLKAGEVEDELHSVTISDEDGDEIQALLDFL